MGSLYQLTYSLKLKDAEKEKEMADQEKEARQDQV